MALAVFAGLVVLSLGALGWYLMAGHSWNVAASNIDDTFGSMEGYTAIVYAGLDHPKRAASGEADGEPPASAGSEGGADDGAAGGGTDGAADGAPGATGSAGASHDGSAGAAGAASAASGAKGKKPFVTVAEAKESYEEKGATVFALDTAHPERYEEGTILKKGEHRFGVFSVLEPASKRALEREASYFAEHEVDFVVALVGDKELVEGVEGIDIALSVQDEDLFVMGETLDGTFYVDAPDEGSVGAILISPSNVVSAKVIEEL